MKRLTCLTLIMLGALSLGACGLRSGLDRPPPLWGHPEGAEEAPADAGGDTDAAIPAGS